MRCQPEKSTTMSRRSRLQGGDSGQGSSEREHDDFFDGGEEFGSGAILGRGEEDEFGVGPEGLEVLNGGGCEEGVAEGGGGEDADAADGGGRGLRAPAAGEAGEEEEGDAQPAVEISIAGAATLHCALS